MRPQGRWCSQTTTPTPSHPHEGTADPERQDYVEYQGGSAPCISPLDAMEVDVGVSRVLRRHETPPVSPRPLSTSATTCPSPSLPPSSPLRTGSRHRLVGLATRPELNGRRVRFLRLCRETCRCVVELEGGVGDAPLRVKPTSLVGDGDPNSMDEDEEYVVGPFDSQASDYDGEAGF